MKKMFVCIPAMLLLSTAFAALNTPVSSAAVSVPVNLDVYKNKQYQVITPQPKNPQVTPANKTQPPTFGAGR